MTLMNFDLIEYEKWKSEQIEKAHRRFVTPKPDRKDPRMEKLRDFRLSRSPSSPVYFDKESKFIQDIWAKKMRMKFKRELYNEAYYRIRPRDYKTYGWETW